MLKTRAFFPALLALCAFLALCGCANTTFSASSVTSAASSIAAESTVSVSSAASVSSAETVSSAAAVASVTSKKQMSSASGNAVSAASSDPVARAQARLSAFLTEKKLLKVPVASVKIDYDHDASADGHDYYVFQVYSVSSGHTSTLGWYGVRKDGGGFYDFVRNKSLG